MQASRETRASRARTSGGSARPAVRVRGRVREALPGCVFRVEIEKGERVLAHVGKEMRVHSVRLIPGDRVVLEISPRDRARGRIIERL